MNSLLDPHHGAIFHCPLCEWTRFVPPLHVDQNALADQFGPGVLASAANMSRLEAVERDLHDHLSQHTLVQWITKVRTLEREVASLKGDLAQWKDKPCSS